MGGRWALVATGFGAYRTVLLKFWLNIWVWLSRRLTTLGLGSCPSSPRVTCVPNVGKLRLSMRKVANAVLCVAIVNARVAVASGSIPDRVVGILQRRGVTICLDLLCSQRIRQLTGR